MRRIKLVLATSAVLVGMLALNAGPAMADEFDEFFIEEDSFGDEVLLLDEGTATFDELCSPFLPEGIFIPGCIFSDPIEEEVVFFEEDVDFDDVEVVFLLEEDIDFDDDDDENHDNERESLRIIDRD